MTGRYPHCPIAPGKGCQCCYDMAEMARRARRASVRDTLLSAGMLALYVVVGVALWLVTR